MTRSVRFYENQFHSAPGDDLDKVRALFNSYANYKTFLKPRTWFAYRSYKTRVRRALLHKDGRKDLENFIKILSTEFPHEIRQNINPEGDFMHALEALAICVDRMRVRPKGRADQPLIEYPFYIRPILLSPIHPDLKIKTQIKFKPSPIKPVHSASGSAAAVAAPVFASINSRSDSSKSAFSWYDSGQDDLYYNFK